MNDTTYTDMKMIKMMEKKTVLEQILTKYYLKLIEIVQSKIRMKKETIVRNEKEKYKESIRNTRELRYLMIYKEKLLQHHKKTSNIGKKLSNTLNDFEEWDMNTMQKLESLKETITIYAKTDIINLVTLYENGFPECLHS